MPIFLMILQIISVIITIISKLKGDDKAVAKKELHEILNCGKHQDQELCLANLKEFHDKLAAKAAASDPQV